MSKLQEQKVMSGFFWGALLGAVVALFRAPRISTGQPLQRLKQVKADVQERLETVIAADPISESIAEGKAAARRRLAEIGQASKQLPE